MTTIAHISDLHFGRLDEPVAEALRMELSARRPGVLVVSGDLTQRARAGEYRRAVEFLRRLSGPQVVMAGNHDVPLYNLLRRFLWPHGRFRRLVHSQEYPEFRDDSVYVLGLNTARSFTFTSGWITPGQLTEARRRFDQVPAGTLTILVTHHPFIAPPDVADADVLVGGRDALAALQRSRVDLLLAGHLHLAYHGDVIAHFPELQRSVLSIQAGTACSTRRRGQPNAYNWITWDAGQSQLTCTVRAWDGKCFVDSAIHRYRRTEKGWDSEN